MRTDLGAPMKDEGYFDLVHTLDGVTKIVKMRLSKATAEALAKARNGGARGVFYAVPSVRSKP